MKPWRRRDPTGTPAGQDSASECVCREDPDPDAIAMTEDLRSTTGLRSTRPRIGNDTYLSNDEKRHVPGRPRRLRHAAIDSGFDT